MRTPKEQIKNFIKGMFFGLFVVAIMVSTTGCPDKDKSRSRNDFGRYGTWGNTWGGTGSYGSGQVAYIGLGADMQGRADLILEASQENYDPTYGYGSGPAYLAGELNVMAPIMCAGGGYALEPGYYQLQSQGSPASMYGELLQSATVVAYDGYSEVVMQLSNMYFFRATNPNQYDGLVGTVYIERINGYFCGATLNISDMAW